jgi:hypothetical protein
MPSRGWSVGTGRVPPGTQVPSAAEVLHATQRTRVTRLSFGGRTVVLKEPLGPDAQQRVRHEVAMLTRLRGIPGIAQLVEEPRYPRSISLADAGTTDLRAVTTQVARRPASFAASIVASTRNACWRAPYSRSPNIADELGEYQQARVLDEEALARRRRVLPRRR